MILPFNGSHVKDDAPPRLVDRRHAASIHPNIGTVDTFDLNFEGTSQDLQKTVPGWCILGKIILELGKVGLLVETGHRWKLIAEPQVIVALELLARAFEYPLTHQKLLDLVTNCAS